MGGWAESFGYRGFWIGIIAMILVVTGSNILLQIPINDWLTWGAFTYPVAFLVNDLTNRSLGPAVARRVVCVGFAVGVVLSIYVAGWRIGLASGGAFLVAQLLDVQIFDRLRRIRKAKPLRLLRHQHVQRKQHAAAQIPQRIPQRIPMLPCSTIQMQASQPLEQSRSRDSVLDIASHLEVSR